MGPDARPGLPGTLHGLLDAGTRLYRGLAESDALLQDVLATLAGVEFALGGSEQFGRLLLDVREALRAGAAGQAHIDATLRRYAPHQ